MKGNDQIIEALNTVLTAELTAINQYFVHHKMCENWGYKKLSAKKREESIEEMKHADDVIEVVLEDRNTGVTDLDDERPDRDEVVGEFDTVDVGARRHHLAIHDDLPQVRIGE